MDTKGLQKEFISWCKSKNKSPKNEDETKLLFVAFMKEKHPEEYKQAVLNQQKQQAQAKKAAHGAKLNYLKSLKNQCAEDEEVVYYKKGGSVKCGCKKKEEGGEVKKDCGGSSIVSQFKKMRAGGLSEKKATTKEGWDNKGNYIVTKEGIDKRKKLLEANKNEEGQADPNKTSQIKSQPKSQPKSKLKLIPPAKLDHMSCGSKIKKHQEGSVIALFKKHFWGGKLGLKK